jgi:uncharacterized lipoprotein YajG
VPDAIQSGPLLSSIFPMIGLMTSGSYVALSMNTLVMGGLYSISAKPERSAYNWRKLERLQFSGQLVQLRSSFVTIILQLVLGKQFIRR